MVDSENNNFAMSLIDNIFDDFKSFFVEPEDAEFIKYQIQSSLLEPMITKPNGNAPYIAISQDIVNLDLEDDVNKLFVLFMIGHELAHLANKHTVYSETKNLDTQTIEVWADFFGAKIAMSIFQDGTKFNAMIGVDYKKTNVGIEILSKVLKKLYVEIYINTNSSKEYLNSQNRFSSTVAGIVAFLTRKEMVLTRRFSNEEHADIGYRWGVAFNLKLADLGLLSELFKNNRPTTQNKENEIKLHDLAKNAHRIHNEIKLDDNVLIKGLNPLHDYILYSSFGKYQANALLLNKFSEYLDSNIWEATTHKLNNLPTFQASLFFWLKEYLAHKALELFRKSKQNKVDDIIATKDTILKAKNIIELKNACNAPLQKGLRSLSKPLSGAVSFYDYAAYSMDSFSAINTNLVYAFSSSLELAETTKANHIDIVIELLTFIENMNIEGFKFSVEYENARTKRPKAKAHDAMDSEEFLRFSKEITKYKAKTDFEKCRNILICRILLYSGVTPKELVGLELGKSFVVDNDSMYLKLNNRSIQLVLPRNKLIKYFNQYQELKQKSKHGYFFYGLTNPDEMLTVNQVDRIVKTMLKVAKIERREMSATLLRVSLAVFLYNHRKDGKQFPLSAIQQIMGHKNRADTENMIGFHAKDCAEITNVFLDDDFS